MRLGFGTTLSGVFIYLGVVAAGTAFAVSPAAAQAVDETEGKVASLDCSASMRPLRTDGSEVLQLACGGTGFLLGPASEYTVHPVPLAGATVVDQRYEDDRRVWLVTTGDDGQPHLEEISGSIAWAAGRRGSSDLTDIALDLAELETSGVIRLTSTAEGLAGVAAVDVAALASRAREARSTDVASDEQ
jgi:hypothetical protein